MSNTTVIDLEVEARAMFIDAVNFITSKDFEHLYERTRNKDELRELLQYALANGTDLVFLAKKDFSKFFKRVDDLDLVDDIQQLLAKLVDHVFNNQLPLGHISRPGVILTLAREEKDLNTFEDFVNVYMSYTSVALQENAFENVPDYMGEFFKEAVKSSLLTVKVKQFAHLYRTKLSSNAGLLIQLKDPGTFLEVLANDLDELREAQNLTWDLISLHTPALFDIDPDEVSKIIDLANKHAAQEKNWAVISKQISLSVRSDIASRDLSAIDALRIALA